MTYELLIAPLLLWNIHLLLLQQIDGYEPDVDYPAYDAVPRDLSFSCANRLPGYYADIETRCQVWHWCLHSGTMFDFLCPNGTVFNQVSSFTAGR